MGDRIQSAKKTLAAFGNGVLEVSAAMAEVNREIDEMTEQIMKHTYDVSLTDARKVARALVSHAEVTWN